MATKAVSYLRVSGKGQVDGDGFPRQREAINAYAARQGVELVAEYRDEGVSGTRELEHRAGLAALIDRLESNGVRLVLIERADRLARDLLVGEVILGRFRALGVQVVEASSGVELTVGDQDPTRVLIRQVLGAVHQFDKAQVVLKLRAARERQRLKRGRLEGVRPYGYTPAEAQVLELMRELRRKPRGKPRPSYAAVASELNKRAVPTRSGGTWSRAMVCRVLSRTPEELAQGPRARALRA